MLLKGVACLIGHHNRTTNSCSKFFYAFWQNANANHAKLKDINAYNPHNVWPGQNDMFQLIEKWRTVRCSRVHVLHHKKAQELEEAERSERMLLFFTGHVSHCQLQATTCKNTYKMLTTLSIQIHLVSIRIIWLSLSHVRLLSVALSPCFQPVHVRKQC